MVKVVGGTFVFYACDACVGVQAGSQRQVPTVADFKELSRRLAPIFVVKHQSILYFIVKFSCSYRELLIFQIKGGKQVMPVCQFSF